MSCRRIFIALIVLAASPRLAAAGLDLTWNACNTSASGADDVALACDGSAGAHLFGNFQSPQTITGFVAMDAVLDIRTDAATLPPFWHFETGGCNESGLGLSDARPTTLCPNATNGNLWGTGGNDAVAAITSYDAGRGGANRLRVLMTISRSSSSPIAVTAGQNYFGFVLEIASDNATSCGGCSTPAVIGWSKAVLYGTSQTVELSLSGTRSATVALNGGIAGPTVFTVRPESGESSAPATVDVFGRNLVSGTSATLTRSGQADITGTGTTTSTKGDALHTTFDITSRPDGLWNVGVASAGVADVLTSAFRTIGGFTIDSMYPRLGDKDVPVPVTIYGASLTGTPTVRLIRTNYPDIFGIGPVVSADGRSLQCTLPLNTADLGIYEVEVTNGDGAKKTVPGGFEVVTPLRVLSVYPNTVPNTGTVQLSIGGYGFRTGATATLQRAGEADIPGDVVSVDPFGSLLVTRFDLLGRAFGLWNLRVMNPGALPFISGNVVLIANTPIVTSIEPHIGGNTASVVVVITGADIDAGARVSLTRAGHPAIPGSAPVVAPDGRSLTTTFDLNGRPTGIWDVEVTNANNVAGTLPGGFEIREGPRVTAVSPTAAVESAVATLTITGTGLITGTTAKLSRAGEADIEGTSVTVAPNGTWLTGDFDIRGRAGGAWSVTVTSPVGTSASLPNAFTIYKIPIVTSIEPHVGGNTGPLAVVITGSSMGAGATARLTRAGQPAVVGSATVVAPDGLSLTTTFDLNGRATGMWDVEVTNTSGVSGTLPAGFEIREAPRITAVSPSAALDATVATLTISGTGLVTGTTAKLGRAAEADIEGTSVTVAPDGTSLTGDFDIRGRAGGAWNVTVTNPMGMPASLPSAFTIYKIPIVTSISPTFGSDREVAAVTISGSGFVTGSAVRLERSTTVINGNITAVAPGTINATFSLVGKPKGFYDLVVVNPGNFTVRVPTAFEINSAPHIISVTPNAAANTSVVNVTLTGSRFVSGATTRLTAAGQPDIVGTNVVVVSGGASMTAVFDIRGRATGPRNILVTNPNTLTGSLPNGFTVSAMPTVTAIAPTTGVQQQTVSATITGVGFLMGVSVRLERLQAPAILGTVTGIDSGGVATHVSLEIGSAPPGLYDVVVVNPGNLLQRLSGAFEVRTAPQVTSVVPDAALDSSPVTLVISGTHLLPGAQSRLARDGQADIAGGAVTVAPDGLSLVATFDVRGHAAGPWNVLVTNPDLGVAAVPNGFTISKIPNVAAITPAFGTDLDVIATTISGSGFVEGMAVRIEPAVGAPIPGELLGAFPEGSPASASFNLVDAPTGFYDVVVLNPGGIEGRLPAAFEIRGVPHVIGFSPAFCYDTTAVVCTIDGRHFDLGATAQLVSPSSPAIVGTSTVVALDLTRMTTTFDLRGQPTGERALRVVQEDGTVLATSAPFWINSHTFVGVPPSGPGDVLALASVAPNPSRGPTTVTFALASESTVRLTVVDLMGREVAELARGTWPAGRHEARWDGRAPQGLAPTGMYFVHMEAGGRAFMKRFVVAR